MNFDFKKKKRKIIIIDDNEIVRSTIGNMLCLLGYECINAKNGLQGLEIIKNEEIDLALVDLDMPIMNGFDLIEILKKDFPTLPVLVVSGNGNIQSAIKAIQIGAWDFIVKPISDVEVLEKNIKQAFEKADLINKNVHYERHLEEMVERRTRKLEEQTIALERSHKNLSEEICQRIAAEHKLSLLNQDLESKVQERTIQLATVNEKLKQSLTKLQENEIAGRQIQFELLPENDKSISEYDFSHYLLPSEYLSGDFVDYFKVDDTHIVFYFADVSGHGVSSAFITVFLKNFIRKYVDLFSMGLSDVILEPSKICSLLNQDILQSASDKFVTLFYGVIDLRTHKLTCVNCGQYPQPMIYHNEDVDFVNLKGFPLGVIDHVSFDSAEFNFADNTKLVCISDGILDILPQYDSIKDTHDHILDLFNKKNIEDVISKYKLRTTDLPDDVTFLTIERNSK
jgi:serine phosphatase RsbU (regulator of sigma subunit)